MCVCVCESLEKAIYICVYADAPVKFTIYLFLRDHTSDCVWEHSVQLGLASYTTWNVLY